MNRRNLFELDELDLSQSRSELIPERELPEIKGRPKPRPRTILTELHERGAPNDAFSIDEYTISSSGDHDHDFKAKSQKSGDGDATPARLTSETSSFKKPGKGKDPFAVGEHFAVENENSDRNSQRKPKPRPRTKSQEDLIVADSMRNAPDDKKDTDITTSEVTTDSEATSGQSVVQSTSSKQQKNGGNEDYLVVPMPEDEDKDKDKKEEKVQESGSAAAGIFGKWKKAIKTFSKEAIPSRQNSTKRKPRPDDQDVEAGIELQETPPSAPAAQTRTPEKPKKKKSTRASARTIESPPPKSQPSSPSDKSFGGSPQHSTHSKNSNLSKRDLHRRVKDGEFSELLGITIHKTDPLPADPFCTHPVVKVTLMNQDGSYIAKRDISRHRQHLPLNQGEDSDSDEAGRSGGRRSKGRRPFLSRGRSTASSATSNLTNEVILPMLTQPYQISSYKYSVPVREPAWNELILFDESFSKFVYGGSECIFFFEIMDFLSVHHVEKEAGRNRYSGSERGWHKVAWGFLKPVGVNGVRNVNRKLRLQLYTPERLTVREAEYGPEVYSWWKCKRFTKLDATLHVTVKGIAPPSCPPASLQTLLSMRKEELTEAILDSQLQNDDGVENVPHSHRRGSVASAPASAVAREPPVWSRLKGQSCKPPNRLLKALPSSDLDSLKITVSGNVHCVKFSPCGQYLAAGFDTEQLHTVLIFEIPSAVLIKSLRPHNGFIYDLAWRKHFSDESHNYLAAASGDATASIWRCKSDRTVTLTKILLHPSFVYCVRFHSRDANLVATGCFDRIVRIWNIKRDKGTIMESSETESTPLILLDGHASFVNCLEFHPSAKYLFTGDGEGSVYQWRNSSSSQRWNLERNIKLVEHSKRPINSITIHPVYGNKLLVHSRDSCLKIVDVETFLVLQTFHGFKNEKYNIGSTFSPCGNLVLCGSEDSTLCVWDADTTRILQFMKPETSNCIITSVDYHPFDFYVAIGVLSATSTSESCPILLYTYEAPPKLQVSSLVKLKQMANRAHQKHSSEDLVESVRAKDQLKQEILSNRSSPNPTNFMSNAKLVEPQESVDSTEKFMSILSKLDTAMKVTSSAIQKQQDDEDKSSKSEAQKLHENVASPEKRKDRRTHSETSPKKSSKGTRRSKKSLATPIAQEVGEEHRVHSHRHRGSGDNQFVSSERVKQNVDIIQENSDQSVVKERSSKRAQRRQKMHIID